MRDQSTRIVDLTRLSHGRYEASNSRGGTVVVGGSGVKVRDEAGNHLSDLAVTFDIVFPEGGAGDSARAMLPRAVAQSHDRLCTVSRTVELGSPMAVPVRESGG